MLMKIIYSSNKIKIVGNSISLNSCICKGFDLTNVAYIEYVLIAQKQLSPTT
jgi:hypothetical protein